MARSTAATRPLSPARKTLKPSGVSRHCAPLTTYQASAPECTCTGVLIFAGNTPAFAHECRRRLNETRRRSSASLLAGEPASAFAMSRPNPSFQGCRRGCPRPQASRVTMTRKSRMVSRCARRGVGRGTRCVPPTSIRQGRPPLPLPLGAAVLSGVGEESCPERDGMRLTHLACDAGNPRGGDPGTVTALHPRTIGDRDASRCTVVHSGCPLSNRVHPCIQPASTLAISNVPDARAGTHSYTREPDPSRGHRHACQTAPRPSHRDP